MACIADCLNEAIGILGDSGRGGMERSEAKYCTMFFVRVKEEEGDKV